MISLSIRQERGGPAVVSEVGAAPGFGGRNRKRTFSRVSAVATTQLSTCPIESENYGGFTQLSSGCGGDYARHVRWALIPSS